MIDLDHFKEINDQFGHAVGDEVLRGAATAISSVLRQLDCVIRLGGDEFLLVLPGVTAGTAEAIAERARTQISAITALGDHRVTASVGVAQRRANERRSDLFERVDAALYRAKRAGRNREVGTDLAELPPR
jgi:diguanylate cyclase (GGDEF)-like protein